MENTKQEVILRVYDIGYNMDKKALSKIAGFKIEGIWHTSLELHDTEIYIGYGITRKKPGTVKSYGPLVKRISLGFTNCSLQTLEEFVADHSDSIWAPETYHILDHNCNHFTDYLSHFLLDKGIPDHYIELSSKVKNSPLALFITDGQLFNNLQDRES